VNALDELWPPFALRVTCGPLELRALRDDDLPAAVALAHRGVHPPEEMPFLHPWTDARGAELDRTFLQHHWRTRVELTPQAWALDLGVWYDGTLVGCQGVRTRDFPVTRTGTTGSWLGAEHQGQGIGTLMRQAICVLALDHLGFAEVRSEAFEDNPASLAVSRKVGYVRDGTERLVRQGLVATNVRLTLSPDALVRPPYDVEVRGAEAFLELVQARAT
jgi:RimJ/RimL family protein N-acetyltransferase